MSARLKGNSSLYTSIKARCSVRHISHAESFGGLLEPIDFLLT